MLKPITGYEKYYISDCGVVYNKRMKKMKSHINRIGNVVIALTKDGKQHLVSVPKLVAEAYITTNSHLQCFVHHKDGNNLNNDVRNLEWRTYSDFFKEIQKNSCLAKHVVGYSKNGERTVEFVSASAAARAFNVNRSAISKCAAGDIKTVCGFRWSYE